MEAALKFLESEGYSKIRPERTGKVKCPNCGSMIKPSGLSAHRKRKKCLTHPR